MADTAALAPPPWLLDPRGRTLAAVFGAAISGLVAGLAALTALDYVALVCLFGIPAAAVTGFLFGPRAATTRRPAVYATGLGLLAVPIGLGVVWVGTLVLGGDAGGVVWVVPVAAMAIPFAAPVSVPVALLTVFLGRRLVGRSLGRAALIVMLAVVASAGVGAATAIEGARRSERAASGQPLEPQWVDRLFSPVDLRWTVANGSSREVIVYVAEPTADGEGGSVHHLRGCSTASGLEPIGPDWRIHVVPDPQTWPPDYGDPVVTGEERPGQDPVVSIQVGSDGRARLATGDTGPEDCGGGRVDRPRE